MLGLEVSWVSILRLLGWERKAGGGPSTGRLTGHTYFGNQQANLKLRDLCVGFFLNFFLLFLEKKCRVSDGTLKYLNHF